MVLDVVNLLNDLVDVMTLITEVLDLIEEILDLFLLHFKFTILNVKVEDPPNVLIIQLWDQILFFVLRNERNIELVISDHLQHFVDLFLDVLDLLSAPAA